MPRKTSIQPGKVLEFCIDETLKITCLTWKSPGKVLEFEIEKSVGTLYMSAHVLLNLLNELGKRDKMQGLPSILSLFRKFNNTRARMLDSIYHMTLRLL